MRSMRNYPALNKVAEKWSELQKLSSRLRYTEDKDMLDSILDDMLALTDAIKRLNEGEPLNDIWEYANEQN